MLQICCVGLLCWLLDGCLLLDLLWFRCLIVGLILVWYRTACGLGAGFAFGFGVGYGGGIAWF